MAKTGNKIYETEYPYLITSNILFGLPLFGIQALAQNILGAMTFIQEKKGVKIYAYVIMENHVHFIAKSDSLAKKISAFKSYTARSCIDHLKMENHSLWLRKLHNLKLPYKDDRDFQFWQEGYHPKQIIGDDMMIQKIDYIHNNPVKRGYVDEAEHWRYSSARNYLYGEGLIPITCI